VANDYAIEIGPRTVQVTSDAMDGLVASGVVTIIPFERRMPPPPVADPTSRQDREVGVPSTGGGG
jgi:hypothetical protein